MTSAQPIINPNVQHIGFTGTRHGMSARQWQQLRALIAGHPHYFGQRWLWWHHGDCIGSDAESVLLARAGGYLIQQHPPIGLLDWRANTPADIICQPRPPLQRNRDIVLSTALLIAAPHGPEQLRSGTWATIRYARKLKRDIIILER